MAPARVSTPPALTYWLSASVLGPPLSHQTHQDHNKTNQYLYTVHFISQFSH